MKIINKKTDEIIPYVNNPRINTGAVDKVASSIKNFGFKVPIVIDGKNEIITGHTRLLASKKLKLDKVPCLIADDLSEAQIKAYRIADNKVAEYSEWDNELLNIEFEALKEMDFDLELTGFDMDEIDLSFEDEKEVEEDDFDCDSAIDDIVEPVAKRGDIYKLGEHRLMCGDSTSEDDVGKLMNGEKADMVFTDPPYEIEFDYKYIDNHIDNAHVFIFNNDRELINQLKKSNYKFKSFFVFYHSGCAIPQEGGHEIFLAHVLISHEVKGKPTTRYNKGLGLRTVLKGEYRRSVLHKHEKPQDLLCNILKGYSNESNITLDLFGGSGSTLIACEQTNRKCYMMELDEKYVDVIIKRWEERTGNKAELIEG